MTAFHKCFGAVTEFEVGGERIQSNSFLKIPFL